MTANRQARRATPVTTRWPAITDEDWSHRGRLRGEAVARAWGECLGQVRWEMFATLTFDPTVIFPVSHDTASRETFRWLGLVGYACRRPVVWVYAVERGKSGLWHAHALLYGAGRPDWRSLTAIWRGRNGIARVQRVDNARGVALYTTKDATNGEVVVSDTIRLAHFRSLACGDIVVPLVSEAEAHGHP